MIFVSTEIIYINDETAIREVLLHEIAHALVGCKNHHNKIWKRKAIEIGCIGSRIIPDFVKSPIPEFIGICPNGHTAERHRVPKMPVSCATCSNRYDPRYLIKFKVNPEIKKSKHWYSDQIEILT